MSEKSLEIRADIVLRQWGRWARGGLAKTNYPTKPSWNRLLGEFSVDRDTADVEACDSLIVTLKPLRKAIVTTYYKTLLDKVKDKRMLARATMLYLNAKGEHQKISTQKVSSTIEFTQDTIINKILAQS